jgi:hypothetical protein
MLRSGVFQDIYCATTLSAFLIEFNNDAPDACMFFSLYDLFLLCI